MTEIREFRDMDTELNQQIEAILPETKQGMDDWMEMIFKEFDWITQNHPKVSDALKEIQAKLRELEDTLALLVKKYQSKTPEADELRRKINILKSKIKDVYKLYKK